AEVVATPSAPRAAEADVAATPAAPLAAEVAKKKTKILGFEVSASERGAKKALVGASVFLVGINFLGLPFLLPKMRKFLGAPYVPMKHPIVQVLFERVLPTWVASRSAQVASSVGPGPLAGLRLVDIGSGDGRIVAAAAKMGMTAVGYELNPYMYWWSRLRTRGVSVSAPGVLQLRWENAWNADLRNVDVVTVYGRPGDGLMERMAAKWEQELPPQSAVVSHYFDIPGWERLLVQDVNGLKLYDLSRRKQSGAQANSQQSVE
ncbi:unnamed protein product, partial [Polarella glacialis]